MTTTEEHRKALEPYTLVEVCLSNGRTNTAFSTLLKPANNGGLVAPNLVQTFEPLPPILIAGFLECIFGQRFEVEESPEIMLIVSQEGTLISIQCGVLRVKFRHNTATFNMSTSGLALPAEIVGGKADFVFALTHPFTSMEREIKVTFKFPRLT